MAASYEREKGEKVQSWEEYRAGIEGGDLRKSPNGNGGRARAHMQNQDSPADEQEGCGDLIEVEGKLSPLVQEGIRIMVCMGYELKRTRHGSKDYLYWIDEDTGQPFNQFFHHYGKYPVESKAVRNYIAALGERPKRLDRISLRNLIGLRAEVYVETVKPEYNVGTLKGQPMPESLHYSKVAEIICPLGRVDLETLKQLKDKC